MATKRKKIGKNSRLRLKEKKRRENAAAANAAAEASASKVFWPRAKNTTNDGASAGSASTSTRQASQSGQFTSRQSANDDHGREFSIGMAKPRENKHPKYKVTQGYAEDHERRLKLIELHIESVADMFTKNRLDIDRTSDDMRDLINAFNGAVDEGKIIGEKTDMSLAILERLVGRHLAVSEECRQQNRDIEAIRSDIKQLYDSLTEASIASKAPVVSMEAIIDQKVGNLEVKVEAELQRMREVFEERLVCLEQSTIKTAE